jgi:BirA family biotin operon repressor/biotin-[acetyl-CoA-carboxylase] ligase
VIKELKRIYERRNRIDNINEYNLKRGLKTKILGNKIYYFENINSTNTFAKQIAAKGCRDGALVIADIQSEGRGRQGRVWESKDKKGIWMSVVLKPNIAPIKVQVITLGVSVAVIKGIMNTTGIIGEIKWPNDILLNGKKVCGILTEMQIKQGYIDYIVVGIGLNVTHSPEDFQSELSKKATSLKIYMDTFKKNQTQLKRSDIIKSILFELEEIYSFIKKGKIKKIINAWKEYSTTLGKEIKVLEKNREYLGKALYITDEGSLVVMDANGIKHTLISEEISVQI